MHNSEFKKILMEIKDQNWSLKEWVSHEADDWFQTEHFHGGFEADESYENGVFNFSYYDESENEWWFTFRLEDIDHIMKKGLESIVLIDPEKFDYDAI